MYIMQHTLLHSPNFPRPYTGASVILIECGFYSKCFW